MSVSFSSNGPSAIGETGAKFSVTVNNTSGSAITLAGLGAQVHFPNLQQFVVTSESGSGWNCDANNNCSRTDSLAAGASYPAITVVGNPQGGQGTFQLGVAVQLSTPDNGSGTGTWNFNFSVPISAASLSITKSHTGNFTQGQQDAEYTITVSNASNAASTSGSVTVTENPPAGLSLSPFRARAGHAVVSHAAAGTRSRPAAAIRPSLPP